MRKLIIALALCFSGAANADLCTSIYDLSGSIIEARERGIPYEQSVKIANESSEKEDRFDHPFLEMARKVFFESVTGF